jgi:hypothetical protein
MAVGIRLKFSGGTQEQYDTTHRHMGIDSNPPEGLIFHMAGPIDGGWGVIDVWESREAFDRFGRGLMLTTVQELGDQALPGPPDLKEFPVHNFDKP